MRHDNCMISTIGQLTENWSLHSVIEIRQLQPLFSIFSDASTVVFEHFFLVSFVTFSRLLYNSSIAQEVQDILHLKVVVVVVVDDDDDDDDDLDLFVVLMIARIIVRRRSIILSCVMLCWRAAVPDNTIVMPGDQE